MVVMCDQPSKFVGENPASVGENLIHNTNSSGTISVKSDQNRQYVAKYHCLVFSN